jgi:hypothetical protein
VNDFRRIAAFYKTVEGMYVPESIVMKYDHDSRPVYRNIYFSHLQNDDLPVDVLSTYGFIFGTSCFPDDIGAWMVAVRQNTLGPRKDPSNNMQRRMYPTYAKKFSKLQELKEILRNVIIEPIDGWTGFKIETDRDRIRTVKVIRDDSEIRTYIKYFEIKGKWAEQVEQLEHSDEYRDTIVWLCYNNFL